MNVWRELHVVTMQTAQTLMVLTLASVKLDMKEMEQTALVNFCYVPNFYVRNSGFKKNYTAKNEFLKKLNFPILRKYFLVSSNVFYFEKIFS